MPLLLIGHHEAGQKIPFNPRLGHDQLHHPIDFGCRGVAAGIREIRDFQIHLVHGIHPQHGGASADAVKADIAALGHVFRGSHFRNIARPAKIALFEGPGNEIKLSGLFEKLAADLDPQLRVPEQGLIIHRHAAIRGQHFIVPGQNERVDLQGAAVQLAKDLIELVHNIRNLPEDLALDPHGGRHVQGVIGHQPFDHIHVEHGDLVPGHGFDLHPAFAAEHQNRPADVLGRVDHHPGIKFLNNIQLFFYQDLFDLKSLDLHPQNVRCGLSGFLRGVGKLDRPGFAPAAGPDLGFDHHRPVQFGCRLFSLLRGIGHHSLWNRNAAFLEMLLALIFKKFSHPASLSETDSYGHNLLR